MGVVVLVFHLVLLKSNQEKVGPRRIVPELVSQENADLVLGAFE